MTPRPAISCFASLLVVTKPSFSSSSAIHSLPVGASAAGIETTGASPSTSLSRKTRSKRWRADSAASFEWNDAVSSSASAAFAARGSAAASRSNSAAPSPAAKRAVRSPAYYSISASDSDITFPNMSSTVKTSPT